MNASPASEKLLRAAREERDKLDEALDSMANRYGQDAADEMAWLVKIGLFLDSTVAAIVQVSGMDKEETRQVENYYAQIMSRLVSHACLVNELPDEKEVAAFCSIYIRKALRRLYDTEKPGGA